MYIHVCENVGAELKLLQIFKMLCSKLRIFVLVDNAHSPTLKLLRVMGVSFIISLHDSLKNIGNLLQDSSMVSYMSPDLHIVTKAILPSSHGLKNGRRSMAFNIERRRKRRLPWICFRVYPPCR